MKGIIEHEGIIIARVASNKFSVKILQQSACASCQMAAMCTAAESKEKIIDATCYDTTTDIGDNVIVYGKTALGYKALALAVGIPFIVSLLTLLIVTQWCNNEIAGGISALLILVPYYILLALMKNKLKKEFIFYIKRKN